MFREGGIVLTNEHVVGDNQEVELALASGERVPAQVVGTDPITDLAVLRSERTDLPTVTFREDLPAIGEVVLAIGSPLGFRNSVTMGIVSGVGREIPGAAEQSRCLVDLIQTDAAISPGSSGGALVGTGGRVVGSPTPTFRRRRVRSPRGSRSLPPPPNRSPMISSTMAKSPTRTWGSFPAA